MSRRVLVIAYMATHFREMFRAALWCRESGRYEPIFLFPEEYSQLETDVARCDEHGIRWFRFNALEDVKATTDPPAASPRRRFRLTFHSIGAAIDRWRRRLGSLLAVQVTHPALFQLRTRVSNRCRIIWLWIRVRVTHATRVVRMHLSLGSRLRALNINFNFNRLRSGSRWLFQLPSRVITRVVNSAATAMRWVTAKIRRSLRSAYLTVRSSVRELSGDLPLFYFAYRQTGLDVRYAEAVIAKIRPSLVLLPEDNVNYGTGALIRAAETAGIPSVVIPFTLVNPREPAEAFFNRIEYQMCALGNRLVSRYRPRWKHTHKGRTLVRMPWYWAAARELHGLAPPRPWYYNSGNAAAIALESEEARRVYLGYGFPKKQLVVTGNLRMDELASHLRRAPERRARLLEELGMPADRRLILCALTVDLVGERPGCGFTTYDDLVKHWISTLTSLPNTNVIVNLHPSLTPERMSFVERFGCRIVRDDVSHLIPLCDIYNVCVSATTVMAIACGKPVVNYDVYRFHYDDFDRARGVVTVSRPADFARIMKQLVTDSAFYDDLAQRQQSVAAEWGMLDGCVGDRLGALFDRLTSPSQHAHV